MKHVIISGASSGIGLATAERFSQAGYTVFILDIKKAEKQIAHSHFMECDVSQCAAIKNAVQTIAKTTHQIDALVCNAGMHFSATIQDTTEEDYQRVMDLNFKGAFFLTQATLPLMMPHKKGAIVLVGSDQTLIAKHHSAIYGASKAALGSLAKTTAIDYAKYGIRCNLVAPGSIDTPLYHQAVERYCQRTGTAISMAEATEAAAQPLGRVGQANEVADLIYFLCSDSASFITGGIYPIDGGYTAQ